MLKSGNFAFAFREYRHGGSTEAQKKEFFEQIDITEK